jgi:hypothetical protein
MNERSRILVSIISTYIVVHVIYWLTRFNPFRTLKFPIGLLVDLCVWILVFIGVFWIYGKLNPGKNRAA